MSLQNQTLRPRRIWHTDRVTGLSKWHRQTISKCLGGYSSAPGPRNRTRLIDCMDLDFGWWPSRWCLGWTQLRFRCLVLRPHTFSHCSSLIKSGCTHIVVQSGSGNGLVRPRTGDGPEFDVFLIVFFYHTGRNSPNVRRHFLFLLIEFLNSLLYHFLNLVLEDLPYRHRMAGDSVEWAVFRVCALSFFTRPLAWWELNLVMLY